MTGNSNESVISSSRSDNGSRPTGPDASTAHDLLSSRRRRLAVSSLRRDGETPQCEEIPIQRDDAAVSVTSLAERVAATEEGTTPEAVADETRRDCRISLHHLHLPKLAAAGLVEYDGAAGRVRPTRRFEGFAEYL